MKTVIATIAALIIGIGGTVYFYHPTVKKPTAETVMAAKFKYKELQSFFYMINKNTAVLYYSKDTTQKKLAVDSINMANAWLGNNIDSIYTGR